MRKVTNIIILLISIIVSLNIYNGQRKLIVEEKNKLASLRIKEDLLKEMVGIEQRFSDFKKSFKTKDNYEMIGTVSNLAEQAGLKINKVQPLGEEEEPLYTKSKLKIILIAKDYHSLGNFVAYLEKSLDLYKVESLSITSPEAEGRIEVEMVLVRFTFKG